MENIPSSVAAGNAFDDSESAAILKRSTTWVDYQSPFYEPSESEVELDRWISQRLSKTPELWIPPPLRKVGEEVFQRSVLRYFPETEELVLVETSEVASVFEPVPYSFANEPVAFCGETVTLQIGNQDVVVKHKISGGAIPNHAGGGKRGKITRLSKASIKRMKLASRNVPEGAFQAFVTLTYPDDFPTDGLKVKRDLSVFRKWLKRRGIGAFWFLEFQKRGAPHYHLFLSSYPLGGVQAVAKAWFRIVGSRDPKHLAWHLGQLSGRSCLEYVRKPHVASYYATKYAAKQEQKDVPADYANVGRFWGMFGAIRPVWRFVVGHGSHCGKVTKDLVNNFRCSFDDRAKQAYWLQKTFVSTVMWGGAVELSDIMAFVKWTPF